MRDLMSSMAALLLKAQSELSQSFPLRNELLDSFTLSFDVQPKLNGSSNTQVSHLSSSFNLDPAKNEYSLVMSDGTRKYQLTLPADIRPDTALRASVTLTDKNGETVYPLGGSAPALNVPAEFQELHSRVQGFLKHYLPPQLLKNLSELTKTSPSALETSAAMTASVPSTSLEESAPSGDAPQASVPVTSLSSFLIRPDDGPNLRFEGEFLARAQSVIRQGRQMDYLVFRTKGGSFVGVKLGKSFWVGEKERVETKVVKSLAELVEFFGYSPLSKALYAQLDKDDNLGTVVIE